MKKRSAFTLIEILVVVFIIAVLASLVIVNLNTSRAKARDTERKANLASMRNALEIYADNFSFYPMEDNYGSEDQSGDCGPSVNLSGFDDGSLYCQWNNKVTHNRTIIDIESFPQDPRSGEEFQEVSGSGSGSVASQPIYNYAYNSRADGSGYLLGASLETGDDAHVILGYQIGVNTTGITLDTTNF